MGRLAPDMQFSNLRARIDRAALAMSTYVAETPLQRSEAWGEEAGASVFFKLENLAPSGSFKVRGAFAKLLSLPTAVLGRGVVAASTGNHGAAVAYALSKLDATGLIFVPEGASEIKIGRIRDFGGEVRFAGKESGETERLARAYAEERDLTYISPYNDWDVVAGQGTIGREISASLPTVDIIVASLGGGGLIGGIGAYLKSARPQTRIVAASPRNSAAMIASLRAGRIVEVAHLPTLSDGTAGGVEPGAITFELCRGVVDECVLVDEDEIAASMERFAASEDMAVEGAAGVALAALRHIHADDATVAVVICGGNVEPLKDVLAPGRT